MVHHQQHILDSQTDVLNELQRVVVVVRRNLSMHRGGDLDQGAPTAQTQILLTELNEVQCGEAYMTFGADILCRAKNFIWNNFALHDKIVC